MWSRERLDFLIENGPNPRGLLVERRACSHLRPSAYVPLDHANLSFDGLLPPWHHAHVAHAGAVLLVDRHERMHPVVASPLLEVPSAEIHD